MRVVAFGFVVVFVACTGGADNGNGSTGQGGAGGQTSSTTQSVSTGQGGMGGQGGVTTSSGSFGGCDGVGGDNGCADASDTTQDALYKCGAPAGEFEACVTLTLDDNSVVTAITESSNGNVSAEQLACIEKRLIGTCVALTICGGHCGELCYCVVGL